MASRLLICVVVLVTVAAVNCNPEVDTLIDMKNLLIDKNNVLESWDPASPDPCSWAHITCNDEKSVIRLELGNAGLSGSLAPQIPVLKNLQYLEAPNNSLTGEIPPGVGDLKSLISLDLQQNALTGVIPGAFSSLKSLKFMRLNSNNLSGIIPPEVIELAFAGNLRVMNISDNSLYGSFQRANSTGFVITQIIQDPKAEE